MITIYWICIMFVAMFWIQGVNCLFSEGHLLEKLGDWVYDHLPEWIYKPTIGCPMCMSSVHGTLWYLLFIHRDWQLWPAFCICLCGINYVISKFTNKERIIVKDEDN